MCLNHMTITWNIALMPWPLGSASVGTGYGILGLYLVFIFALLLTSLIAIRSALRTSDMRTAFVYLGCADLLIGGFMILIAFHPLSWRTLGLGFALFFCGATLSVGIPLWKRIQLNRMLRDENLETTENRKNNT